MIRSISPNVLFSVCITISCLFLSYYYIIKSYNIDKIPKSLFNYDEASGFISSLLYNELNSYISSRNKTIEHIKKLLVINNETVIRLPLNPNYIKLVEDTPSKTYPYSTWKCSNTSNTDPDGNEYCILTNIYYQSSTNQYYFYQNPSENNVQKQRDTFKSSYGPVQFQLTSDISIIKNLHYSSILTQPILFTHPADENYAHSFLESCGPRFWVISEIQSHSTYIDPSKIQIYFSSKLFDQYPHNWHNYREQSDGTYLPQRKWEYMLQSMFSIYPLLTHRSFNKQTVLFKYLVFTGTLRSRTPVWLHHYDDRVFSSYPFPTINYQRSYLAYSEWILNNFNLKSKFQLTNIQEKLQKNKHLIEHIPICDQKCSTFKQSNISTDDFTGEWIVVLNRAGIGRREIINADELVKELLKIFPDHTNPYLRVYPKQVNFNDNLYRTARLMRSTRLLIGVHGAGLSNCLFMRPGAILYEINSHGCRYLSFNFRRWAEVFQLQHSLWIPSVGNNGRHDNSCNKDSSIKLNIKEIIDEIKRLLANEAIYRNGYLKRALMIMKDTSIGDHPPTGFENIL